MKTAKRFSALVLALALLLALTGCGAPVRNEAPAPSTAQSTPMPSTSSEAEQQEADGEAEAADSGMTQDGAAAPLEENGISGAESGGDNASPAPPEAAAPVCTVSISCAAVLDRMDELSSETAELIPSDGVLLPPTQVALAGGESAFDVLRLVCQENRIHMEFSETPVYQSAYIEGIGNLYEFACGSGSGWMYRVNGVFPNYGCSRCALADGDVLEWVYTCDYGADIGGGGTEAAA